jgi:hypothetical protein
MSSIRRFIAIACVATISACSTVMTTPQSVFLSATTR